MKFITQHIKVPDGNHSYGLHRDGNVTWETKSGGAGEDVVLNVTQHASVSAAKAVLGSITSSPR